ncbi:MAG TPA: thymidylate synthase [Verrucomicrobiae bacterium]|nr:thymidylate synthase [Verrucomicrobiae bacterium]
MSDEGLEILGSNTSFRITTDADPILERFGDRAMIEEMKKVFFSNEPNALGHSYARLIQGPGGRNDLQDVIALLRCEPQTKRALVNFLSQPGKKVPCISAVQFLVREGALQLMYFARGQDVFRKFYADGLCLLSMAQAVASALGMPTGTARGFIGSAHVYHKDMPEINLILECSSLRELLSLQASPT